METRRPAAVEIDTERACQRAHTAAAWTQLLYQTGTWRNLARRADRRDPDAWDEIGDLVEHNFRHVRDTVCTKSMLKDVRATAGRLRRAH